MYKTRTKSELQYQHKYISVLGVHFVHSYCVPVLEVMCRDLNG
jgi:hypothetical protein